MKIFVTGGTGYLGRSLIPELIQRGHEVQALVRPGSEHRLPRGASPVTGNPLIQESFADQVSSSETFIQLVGVPHPNPSKAKQFREVDLVSALASIEVATKARVSHFIYVSVAHPAPTMKAYQAVRKEAETALRESGLNATVLRPLYVLGPGHWWPYFIVPVYWVLELLPSTREMGRRIGLVTLKQMVSALIDAVEHPATGTRIVEVPEIRK